MNNNTMHDVYPLDFTTYISKNTKTLNILMKSYFEIPDEDAITSPSNSEINKKKRDAIEKEINMVFFKLVSMALPHYSNNRISSDSWILSTDIELIPNQICLLALSNAPIRLLAVVNKSQHRRAKDTVEGLQLSVRKIILVKDSKENSLYFKIEPNQENFFFSIKRGFYIYELNTLNKKLSAIVHKNELMLRENQMADITDIYFTYVDGMTERPTNELERSANNYGFEQFLLGECPTKEWKEHMKHITESGSKGSKKRFVSDHEEMEEEMNAIAKKQANKRKEEMNASSFSVLPPSHPPRGASNTIKPAANNNGRITDVEAKSKYIRLMEYDLLDYKPIYTESFFDHSGHDDILFAA